jgi:hypothetical protein
MIELAVYPCGQVICNRRGFLMQRSFMFLARFASIRKCATNVLMTRNHRVSDTIEPADTIEDLCCNAPGLLLVASKLLRKAGNDTKVLTSKCASVMEFGNAPCVYVMSLNVIWLFHTCMSSLHANYDMSYFAGKYIHVRIVLYFRFHRRSTCFNLLANMDMSLLVSLFLPIKFEFHRRPTHLEATNVFLTRNHRGPDPTKLADFIDVVSCCDEAFQTCC